jgi:hypothetical protein
VAPHGEHGALGLVPVALWHVILAEFFLQDFLVEEFQGIEGVVHGVGGEFFHAGEVVEVVLHSGDLPGAEHVCEFCDGAGIAAAAQGARAANLQRTGADDGVAGVGVGPRERDGAAYRIGCERTRAANGARQGGGQAAQDA